MRFADTFGRNIQRFFGENGTRTRKSKPSPVTDLSRSGSEASEWRGRGGIISYPLEGKATLSGRKDSAAEGGSRLIDTVVIIMKT